MLANGILTWVKSEPGTSSPVKTESGVTKEDVKPRIVDSKPNIGDIKPDISRDVKPRISADVKPHLPPGPDVKPSSSALQAADATGDEGDEQDDDDDEEEEDYSEEIIIAPWGSNRPAQTATDAVTTLDDEESEEEIYSEDEVEEVYSEDERESCEYYSMAWLTTAMPTASAAASQSQPSTLPSESHSQSLVPFGSKVFAAKERPTFPCMPEQLQIGPYNIDPEDSTLAIPRSINRFLRNYQREGVDFFYSKYKRGYGGVLGDDMG